MPWVFYPAFFYKISVAMTAAWGYTGHRTIKMKPYTKEPLIFSSLY
jgi:hypothetical protein